MRKAKTVRLNKRGTLTLPEDVRHGLPAGTEFTVRQQGQNILLLPLSARPLESDESSTEAGSPFDGLIAESRDDYGVRHAVRPTTILIPDDLAAQLEPYRDSLDDLLRIGLREVKKEQGLTLFKKGGISLWKAARLAGVSLREMTEYATAQGLRATVDEATIKEELA